MIQFKIIKYRLDKNWDNFVQQHARGNIFQSNQIFELYNRTSDFTPYYCVATSEPNGKIIGGFLFVIQKTPVPVVGKWLRRSLIIGGPLLPQKGAKVFQGLMQTYSSFAKKRSIYSEIRNLHSWSHFVDEFRESGFKYTPHLNYFVPLKNEDLVPKLSKSKVRQVKKGLERGAEIIENPSLEQVEDFYQILKNLYNKRIKKPLPSWSFFKSFYELQQTETIGNYKLVSYNTKIIGGIMLPVYNDKTVYEWYVAGNDHDYKELYPSVLATWAGLKFAKENGFSSFDFMGAGFPNIPYGVRDFKSKFGGQLVNYGRFRKIHFKSVYYLAQGIYSLIKKIS
ncbi:MAG: peptidoglycan bridge formation glycyltransferase FemA/FemB family protein [Bacteroidales bacterium]|nr:peptidoglycan bridge formation glycyltransferase FemA/FemB family protein [Bacteroidales bacterium]